MCERLIPTIDGIILTGESQSSSRNMKDEGLPVHAMKSYRGNWGIASLDTGEYLT